LVLRDTDLSKLPQVAAALTPQAGQPAVTTADNLAGRSVLTAHAAIPQLGWRVFVEVPLSEAFAPLYGAAMRTLVLLAFGLLAPVFDKLLEEALRLCEAPFGGMFVYDGERFYTQALRGAPPAFAEFLREPMRPSPAGALSRIVQGERLVQIADVTADPGYVEGVPARRALAD